MDSTLALGAFRIARGAGGEAVDVNGNLVEREKHHLNLHLNLGVGCAPSCWPIFGFRNLLGAPRGRRGQFSVQSDNRFSGRGGGVGSLPRAWRRVRSEEHTSELQSLAYLVCRLLLEKKKNSDTSSRY